ncbi:ubiquitin carboxyl-terminal hydrolase [Musa troglodytarum]|uniref:Ubiquitin carboxyl-terminal hydrolase n=1 Tax=Musa troglodytarum TaxID=320322 RepID=A0A9E7JX83_9LILI|nr:ubiquitin carboxyl-terminal hydrolase [Musa troglodytarum]
MGRDLAGAKMFCLSRLPMSYSPGVVVRIPFPSSYRLRCDRLLSKGFILDVILTRIRRSWLIPSQGAALFNLGNTCFLNAVLQCLTHTVPLVQKIRRTDHPCSCCGAIGGFCSFCALKGHINRCLFLSGYVISPTDFAENLSKISPHFQLGQQEDAHEFLHSLLDNLHTCCLGHCTTDQPSSLDEDSLVKHVFGGRLRSQLRCCNCGHCSDTFEPLLDLSLEIDNVDSIVDALASFTRSEKIDDPDINFTCEGCKAQVSLEKQLKLDHTPEVLTLHLKRFKNDGVFACKLRNPVEYPLELDLTPCLCCPVDEVFRVSETDVLAQDAYVLFYVKQRSSCWFSNLMEEMKTLMATDGCPSPVLGHAHRYDCSSLVYEDGCSSSSGTSERHEDADPCNNSSPPGPVNNDAFIREGEGHLIETPLGTFKLRNHKNSCDEDLSGPSSCTSCSRR